MFIKQRENESLGKFFLDYETNVRSTYHAAMTVKNTIRGIEKEYEYLKNNPVDTFVVMQAIPKILVGIDGFSVNLNSNATKDNIEYLGNPDFTEWLTQTPIFMVNNSITTAHGFQRKAISVISDFSKKLAKKTDEK